VSSVPKVPDGDVVSGHASSPGVLSAWDCTVSEKYSCCSLHIGAGGGGDLTPNGVGFRKPPLVCGRSMVVVSNGPNVSNRIEAVRDEVLAGSAIGQVGDRGERGGRGGARGGDLMLSCDWECFTGR
jgi:hypothetical protein